MEHCTHKTDVYRSTFAMLVSYLLLYFSSYFRRWCSREWVYLFYFCRHQTACRLSYLFHSARYFHASYNMNFSLPYSVTEISGPLLIPSCMRLGTPVRSVWFPVLAAMTFFLVVSQTPPRYLVFHSTQAGFLYNLQLVFLKYFDINYEYEVFALIYSYHFSNLCLTKIVNLIILITTLKRFDWFGMKEA